MYQTEAMDEVDSAPPASSIQDRPQMKKLDMLKMDQKNDSGFGSLSSNPSGLGSLASNQSLTADFDRMKLAERVFSNSERASVSESCEDGGYGGSVTEEEAAHPVRFPPVSGPPLPVTPSLTDILFKPDTDGDTQLHIAIIHGKSEVVRRIIELAPTPEYVNRPNVQKLTPLHMAVLTDQPLLVRQLLCAGANLEERDEDGNTPLHLACDQGRHRCVKVLTQPLTATESLAPFQRIPQDMEIKNYEGNTCMHLAAQQSQLETLEYLYSTAVGADVNARDGLSGRTVLHHAADVGNAILVAFLTSQHGVRLDATAYNGCTPLQLAAGRNDLQTMQQLMAAGANTRTIESSSESDSSSEDDMMDSFDDFHINAHLTTMCT